MKKELGWLISTLFLFVCLVTVAWSQPSGFTRDFETGNLWGWQKTGNAFNNQPTFKDNPTARHRGEPSNHQGEYWIGTFENYQGRPGQVPGRIQGDLPTGTLTSSPFKVSFDYVDFLVGGGKGPATRVELLVLDPIEQTFVSRRTASGANSETMHRVRWDVSEFRGRMARIRVVDASSGPWGHINADDFRFYSKLKPLVPHLPVLPGIQPSSVRIIKGEKATFKTKGPFPQGAFYWIDPRGHRVKGPVLEVDTSLLNPGTYKIALWRENVFSSLAHVSKPAVATLIVLPPKVHYRLRVTAYPQNVEENGQVRFKAHLLPESPTATYRFNTGDGTVTGWTSQGFFVHKYTKPGTYTATAQARVGENTEVPGNAVYITVSPTHYTLEIRASKKRAEPGEMVGLRAFLSPKRPQARYEWVINPGQIRLAGNGNVLRYRFQREGDFSVLCRAYLYGKQIAVSNVVNVKVAISQPPPRIEILPKSRTAVKGERVRFTARIFPGGNQTQRLSWLTTFCEVSGSHCEVNTGNLEPGSHKIQAEVTDRYGRRAEAEALLRVVPVPRKVVLAVKPQMTTAGKDVQFFATVKPAVHGARYRFVFGDNTPSQWQEAGFTKHSYRRPGRYCSFVEASLKDGKTITSSKVCLEISRAPSYRVQVGANKRNVAPGDEISFRAVFEPPTPDILYRFDFGDGHVRQWSKDSKTVHRYDAPGTYYVKVIARGPETGRIESDKLEIKVRESGRYWWLLVLLIPALYLPYRVWKGRSSGSKKDKTAPGASVFRINAEKDLGSQEISCREAQFLSGTEISITTVKDLGTQEISGETQQ